MKLKTIVPLPPEDYIYNIGLIAYSVGYLEWQLLGDLRGKKDIPNEYKIENLCEKTTGGIATLFTKEELLSQVLDDNLRLRIKQFGEKLKNITKKRNHLLHARPATINNKQKLYRWTTDNQIEIDARYLEEINNDIQEALRQDGKLRV